MSRRIRLQTAPSVNSAETIDAPEAADTDGLMDKEREVCKSEKPFSFII